VKDAGERFHHSDADLPVGGGTGLVHLFLFVRNQLEAAVRHRRFDLIGQLAEVRRVVGHPGEILADETEGILQAIDGSG